MTTYCSHCGVCINIDPHRSYCRDYTPKRQSDVGQVGFDVLRGDVTIGLGGGLVEDVRTGDVELQIAPGIDFDLSTDSFS